MRSFLICYKSGSGRHIAHSLILVALLACCGCLNKIPAIAHYNENATEKCMADVPAIQEKREIPEDERPTCKPMTCPTAKSCWVNAICLPPDTEETVWTCKDKTRILQLAEDGAEWCRATPKTAEACKPLSYPSCEVTDGSCHP